MAGVEILAPLRIETRFYAPDGEERLNWRLRLRVYPDEFSMSRPPPKPTKDELDLFDIAKAAAQADPNAAPNADFLLLAADLGPQRALWLLRHVAVLEVDGVPRADRAGMALRDAEAYPETTRPMGLPPVLSVWLLAPNDAPIWRGEMTLKREEIAADLDLSRLHDEDLLRQGELAKTWWTSYERARDLGLARDIELGPDEPELGAIVVGGMGDQGPEALIEAQAESGRLAVLQAGKPTNTVAGEKTVELGRDPRAWTKLLGGEPSASSRIIELLSGGKTAPVPLLGGEGELPRYDLEVVRGLWPLLWGQAMRDMAGAGGNEDAVREWASACLRPQGPYPAIRVGEQPYGLLPIVPLRYYTSQFEVNQRMAHWAAEWRQAAAAAAASAGNVADAGTPRLVELLGEDAPNRRWGIRPVLPRLVVNLLRQSAGQPPLEPDEWEIVTAKSLTDEGEFKRPLAPFAPLWPLPQQFDDNADELRALFDWEKSYFPKAWRIKLGLFGHLVAATLVLLRARLRIASDTLHAGLQVDADAPLPIYGEQDRLRDLASINDERQLLDELYASGNTNPGAYDAAKRYEKGRDALLDLIGSWETAPAEVLDALFATLDTASHRVDPWATGLAAARLDKLLGDRVPFYLGAYGWVDRPRPATGQPGSPPKPGPTEAGLLHAPSYGQALTAALLRERAVRYPGETNWQMTIDSAKVRGAIRLAERVRLGVHPYEALGLEVERLVGDWDAVRVLRQHFKLRTTHQGQRCCDGARVLRAVFDGAEPLPAGLPPDLDAILTPLREVMDTYADLLLADGVHALVSGEGETAFAAMEAAAGLGAPPELRAMRTPRQAEAVRVQAWVVLPPAGGNSPATVADPAFAALLTRELGLPSAFTWSLDGLPVSLETRGLNPADVFDLDATALAALLRGPLPEATLVSTGGAERLTEAARLATLLGGGEADPPVPSRMKGDDSDELGAALLQSLTTRLEQLQQYAEALAGALETHDPDDAAEAVALAAQLAAWRLPPPDPDAEDGFATAKAALAGRLAGLVGIGDGANALRSAIRALVGRPSLPVVPIVSGAKLGPLLPSPRDGEGHPALDQAWLELVAAVRPRLAPLEARQLDPHRAPWPAAIATGAAGTDPWSKQGPVIVAYGPGLTGLAGAVGIVALDAWVDAIPSSDHATSAAFGFNGPKSRPPQAILLAVPPDIDTRMDDDHLLQTIIEARLAARARAIRPGRGVESFVATPFGFGSEALGFTEAW